MGYQLFLLRSYELGDLTQVYPIARGSAPLIVAFVSVPLSFYAVRIAQSFIHPVVFTQSGANMPDTMLVWFVVSQIAMLALFATLAQLELMQRRAERSLGALKVRLEAETAA